MMSSSRTLSNYQRIAFLGCKTGLKNVYRQTFAAALLRFSKVLPAAFLQAVEELAHPVTPMIYVPMHRNIYKRVPERARAATTSPRPACSPSTREE
jgi:hypothetical protein